MFVDLHALHTLQLEKRLEQGTVHLDDTFKYVRSNLCRARPLILTNQAAIQAPTAAAVGF